ncbi:MAG: hypothetical protein KC502_16885 [Myxococcales bacterium]|nr:hypothetical protein [Myxococcales bacterium]
MNTPTPEPAAKAKAPTSWVRRWLRRFVVLALLVVLLAAGAIYWTLGHLGTSWVQGLAHDAVAQATGIEVSWRAGRLSRDAFELHDLRVASPKTDADLAPTLLHISSVVVPLDIDSLWNRKPKLRGAVIDGVHLAVVMDVDGKPSLSRLLRADPAAKSPAEAKSWLNLLGAVPLGTHVELAIKNVVVTVVQRGLAQAAARTIVLDGMTANIDLDARQLPRQLQTRLQLNGQFSATAGDSKQGPLGLPPLRHVPSQPQLLDDQWRARITQLTRAWKLHPVGGMTLSLVDEKEATVEMRLRRPAGVALPGEATQLVVMAMRLQRTPSRELKVDINRFSVCDNLMNGQVGVMISDGDHPKASQFARDMDLTVSTELAPWLAWVPAPLMTGQAAELSGDVRVRTKHLRFSAPSQTTWQVVFKGRMRSLRAQTKLPSSQSELTSESKPRPAAAQLEDGNVQVTATIGPKSLKVRSNGAMSGVRLSADGAAVQWRELGMDDTTVSLRRAPHSPWGWHVDEARIKSRAVALKAQKDGLQARITGKLTVNASGGHDGLHVDTKLAMDTDAHGERPPKDGATAALPIAATLTGALVSVDIDVQQKGTAWRVQHLATEFRTKSADAVSGAQKVKTRGLVVRMDGKAVTVDGQRLKIGEASLGLKVAHLAGLGVSEPLDALLKVRKMQMDMSDATSGTGDLVLKSHGLGNGVTLKLHKATKSLDWDLTLSAPHLGRLVALAPMTRKQRRQVKWEKLRLDMHSKGHMSDVLRAMTTGIRHTTSLDVSGVDVRLPNFRILLPKAKLKAEGKSVGRRLQQTFAFEATHPRLGAWRGKGRHVATGAFRFAPAANRAHLSAETQIPRGPKWTLRVDGQQTRGRTIVAWAATSTKLKALGRAIPKKWQEQACLDAKRLSGAWKGTLAIPTPRGLSAALKRLPKGDLHAKQSLTVRGLRCRRPTLALASPEVRIDADTTLSAGKVAMDAHLIVRRLRGHVRDRRIDLRGLDQGAKVTARITPTLGTAKLVLNGKIKRFDQDLLPAWPIANARLTGAIVSNHQGAITLENLALHNPKGGTTLTMSGGMDAGRPLGRRGAQLRPSTSTDKSGGIAQNTRTNPDAKTGNSSVPPDKAEALPGRRGFTFTGELTQDMTRLAASTQRVTGRGKIVMPYRLESGDLSLFRLTAKPTFEDVDVHLVGTKLDVKGLRGTLPIVELLRVTDGTVRVLGGATYNALARWRFQDQQPFLSGDPYIGVREIRFGEAVIGPIAGNARLDRNVFRLDQLEARAMGGKLTGQCIVDWQGADSIMLFRGNGTGLKLPGSDGRTDLNAALQFEAGKLALSGQAQLLRTTRAHLEALLDLWDPYRADARINKLRLLLKVGYPKRVRMVFRHGFADFFIGLGGIANLVQIDEIRGIALGPMMQKWVAPYLPRSGE